MVEARLTDASFFVAHDRDTKLSERVRKWQQLSYHPRLGNFLQKTGRIMELAEYLAYQLNLKESIPELLRAAKLMKADLASATVAEFPACRGRSAGSWRAARGSPAKPATPSTTTTSPTARRAPTRATPWGPPSP